MAKDHSASQIVAADMHPPSLPLPPNVSIVDFNAEEDWPFQQNFNFVHIRMLLSSIRDWASLLRRSWEHLEPGGWLEILDFYSPFRADIPSADNPEFSPFIKWGYIADEAWVNNGTDLNAIEKHVPRLQALGFDNIQVEEFRWPLGEWSESERERKIGSMTLENMLAFFRTAAPNILKMHPHLDKQGANLVSADAEKDLIVNCNTSHYFLMV